MIEEGDDYLQISIENPKVEVVDEVTEDIFERELFGIKYTVNKLGVILQTFTPSVDIQNDRDAPETNFKMSSDGLKSFRVSQVLSFFLPLRSSLKGLYEKCLYHFPEALKNDEKISVIWLFQKRAQWKEVAIEMYKSYLKGVDDPSDVELVRRLEDRMHTMINKISSPLQKREYSEEVEKKILDDGYLFQCIVEIKSERTEELASLIQAVFSQYDFYNRMRLKPVKYLYPYILYTRKLDFKHQMLSKNEIMSLLCQGEISEYSEEEVDTTSDAADEVDESESVNVGDRTARRLSSAWRERIELLPITKNEDVDLDSIKTTTLTKLAEALKRTGVTHQARLYNETVEHGSRLIVIHADVPKGKNFSDVFNQLKNIRVELGAHSLGIEQGDHPGTIKYTIPHRYNQTVGLRELIEQESFQEYSRKNDLSFIAGLDEVGNPLYLSLADLIHILVAGKSGGGKSVFLNQLLVTLLLTHTPEELQLLLIDPKEVELNQYESFPHTQDVITNMSKAIKSFNGLVKEMDDRYKSFRESKVKDIDGYNQKMQEKLPRIVCVIEEWADLFSVAGKDAEEVVMRLGAKARAAGIHLIIVTQRPSAKILSGDIKANAQNAFSFNLGNNTNYTTVFDTGIPYTLLGQGDGVMKIEGSEKEFQRFQSPIVTTDKVEESEIYERLAESFSDYESTSKESEEVLEEDPILTELKQIIATTKETKITVLREKLNVKSDTMTELMNQLVNEGWLVKHRNRSKGYELIADDEKLGEWIDTDGGDAIG